MQYLKGKLLYLGGPIQYCQETTNWRLPVIKILEDEFGLQVIDPNADPKQSKSKELIEARNNKDYERIREIARDFVSKDLKLVNTVHIHLARVVPHVPTVGTCQEIVTAVANKTPCLLVNDHSGKENISFWYYGLVHYRYMFSTWDDLYKYLGEVNRGLHKDDRRWKFVYGLI